MCVSCSMHAVHFGNNNNKIATINLKNKGACSDPQPHPPFFFKHMEILVPGVESYLEDFMCEVSCTNSRVVWEKSVKTPLGN